MPRRVFAAVVAVIAITSCGRDVVTVCPADLRYTYTPHDTTISVGQGFTASLSLFGCGGRDQLADTVRFTSSDALTAAADSVTGMVQGVRAGSATITARAKHYHLEVTIPVRVQ